MTPIDQAAKYLDAIPGAVSGNGGHDHTLATVRAIYYGFGLSRPEAESLLDDYNRRCDPPWSKSELNHKLNEVERIPFDKPKGYLLRNGKPSTINSGKRFKGGVVSEHPPESKRPINGSSPLPPPISDGTRALLTACFLPGEGIRIVQAVRNAEGREIPDGAGIVLPLEKWLAKLNANKGDPNAVLASKDGAGLYVAINPTTGSKDVDVTAFRHALLEFDDISLEDQYGLYLSSKLPCSAIISSGGDSIHAWVRVDAANLDQYKERVAILHQQFQPDPKNKNPNRLSRLPNCRRFDKRQELLALNVGAASWDEWVQSTRFGRRLTWGEMMAFEPGTDPNTLIGRRWLCRGGSCLLIGPSGIGKSSLIAQLAVLWGLGRPAFGITPVRPLKSLIVQAENDDGDMSEMVQGVAAGLGIDPFNNEDLFAQLEQNVIIHKDGVNTARGFIDVQRERIRFYKPDLSWIDPALSFIGDDISRQAVCSQFFRTWLNPILEETGTCAMLAHHTPKPSQDKQAKSGWQSSDHSYAGIGSSEMVNWARAVVVVSQIGSEPKRFRVMLSKRGGRAGATHPDGTPTETIYLQHGRIGIHWEQIEPPVESKTAADNGTDGKGRGRPRTFNSSEFDYNGFKESVKGECFTIEQLAARAGKFAGVSGRTIHQTKIITILKEQMKQYPKDNENRNKWYYPT